ncbi:MULTISPECIES: hypothetical protein [unclassified Haladaptatus]|uniref:hypothetical protein n=1 Tax=unclassified Haladaptatus TaxID=2622732 RepID=UPI0023E7C8B9|nr:MULTISPECIES: hypothetical protein [unclassified Haladaptatus]
MGRLVDNLKIYGVLLIATFLILSVAGIWDDFGFGGPFGALKSFMNLIWNPIIHGFLIISLVALIVIDHIEG